MESDVEVSNFGEVRSTGGFYFTPILDKKTGYYKVGINLNGEKKQILIHRLVAKDFVQNPFNKLEVNHKNGDKSNNCQWNLEWNTSEENLMHKKYVLNCSMEGKNNPMYGRSGKKNPQYKEQIYAVNKNNKIVGEFSTQIEAAEKMFNNKIYPIKSAEPYLIKEIIYLCMITIFYINLNTIKWHRRI